MRISRSAGARPAFQSLSVRPAFSLVQVKTLLPRVPIIACDKKGVTFKCKDYRIEGPDRYTVMTLATHEFIRRLLIHVLPAGFHRIRYYGLLASGKRVENVARARELLMPPIIPVAAIKAISANAAEPQKSKQSCPCCGGRMIIIERFERGATPHYRPSPATPAIRIDTS
jgi:hypothetical protein